VKGAAEDGCAPTEERSRLRLVSQNFGFSVFKQMLFCRSASVLGRPDRAKKPETLLTSLSTLLVKTEMLAEELQHMILKAIGNLAGVSSLVLLKAIRDSILIKHVMQFGCVHS
jgi:hypothetical protein